MAESGGEAVVSFDVAVTEMTMTGQPRRRYPTREACIKLTLFHFVASALLSFSSRVFLLIGSSPHLLHFMLIILKKRKTCPPRACISVRKGLREAKMRGRGRRQRERNGLADKREVQNKCQLSKEAKRLLAVSESVGCRGVPSHTVFAMGQRDGLRQVGSRGRAVENDGYCGKCHDASAFSLRRGHSTEDI